MRPPFPEPIGPAVPVLPWCRDCLAPLDCDDATFGVELCPACSELTEMTHKACRVCGQPIFHPGVRKWVGVHPECGGGFEGCGP